MFLWPAIIRYNLSIIHFWNQLDTNHKTTPCLITVRYIILYFMEFYKIIRKRIRDAMISDCCYCCWKLSLASVAADQVFTKVSKYRGTIVRIKDLNFSKRREISRKTMKEMRLMREFRQDNINMFIGAAVEPNRIRIVTEYCHKGSLPVHTNLSLINHNHPKYLKFDASQL